MAQGFQIANDLVAGASVCDPMPIAGKVSTQYLPGDLLVVANGIAEKNTDTGKPTHLFSSLVTPASILRPATIGLTDATTPYEVNAIKVNAADVFLKSQLRGLSAPPTANKACNANATATSVLCTQAGSDNDYDNGTIYCHELNEQRPITDSQETGGVITFTVTPAFSRAVTTGDTVSAVPFSKGSTGVKFESTAPSQGLDTSVAGKTGGNAKIEGVDLAKLEVTISLPYLT